MNQALYNVFLSHNSLDKPAVEELANRLSQNNLKPWFDKWNLIPGDPWQNAIESALDSCVSCAVFMGPSGISPWQNEEMRAAIDRRVREGHFRVIPVLLPGAKREERSRLPSFMAATTWVEFRKSLDDDEAFHRLIAGIRGIEPGPEFKESLVANMRPYRGLETFKPEHAPFFFGREALTEWLLNEISPSTYINDPNRFLAIIGASGSGKSSLALAGLIPALRQGRIEESQNWSIVILRPGKDPLESLAISLKAAQCIGNFIPSVKTMISDFSEDHRHLHWKVGEALYGVKESCRILILIDQFEEIFTLCQEDSVRKTFIENLLYASNVVHGKTILVLTMRADFYSKCAAYEKLAAALSDHQVLVGPMTEDELRRAIQYPAQLLGCEMEGGLAEILINDFDNQPGALPLLQHALSELWDKRNGRWLTRDAYQAIGKLEGALEKYANSVFDKFSESEQQLCRHIFLSLTQPGEGTEDTKRRALVKELIPADVNDESIFHVIRYLADCRLITTEGEKEIPESGYVEVAHEALIRGWSKLRSWIDSDREALRIHRRLSNAASEWEKSGNDESYLYGGARLAEAEEWNGLHGQSMNPIEKEFLEKSIDLREKIISEEILRQKKLRLRAFVATVAAGIAILAAGIAFFAFNKADLEREKAQNLLSKNYLSNALFAKEKNRRLRLLHYGAKAVEVSVNQKFYKNTAYNIFTHISFFLTSIFEHNDAVSGAAFNQDETRILTWSRDGTARLWDAKDGSPIGNPIKHDRAVSGAVFTKNETRILTWSDDGTARLWDAKDGSPIGQPMQHDGDVRGAAFNKGETRILTWSGDGTARLWEAKDGSPIGQPMKHDSPVSGAAFTKDETRILTWSYDGTARLWEAKDGSPIGRPMQHGNGVFGVYGAAFNKGETRILTWSGDGTARLWDAKDGSPIGQPMKHDSDVSDAAFNKDETRILTWSSDGTARLWDAKDGSPIGNPMKHDNSVEGAAFNKGETRILTWSGDGTARLWEAKDGSPIGQPMKHEGSVYGAVFTKDEARILTWSRDGTARLWEAKDGSPIGQPMKHEGSVSGAVFTKDEARILTWSGDGTARLWEAKDGSPIGQPMKHDSAVSGAAFTKDETRILTWSGDGTARLWEVKDGSPISQPMKHDSFVYGAVLTKDETRILTWSYDDTARLWDAKDGSPIGRPMKHGMVLTVRC